MSTVQLVPRPPAARVSRAAGAAGKSWDGGGSHPASRPADAPGRDGFVALLAAFRASGGTAPGEVLGALMQERRGADAAGLAWLIRSGQVFGFEWRASLWLPMFQFDADDLAPKAGQRRVREALPSWHSGWATAGWFAAPNRWLDGACPADRMADDPDAVLQAALALTSIGAATHRTPAVPGATLGPAAIRHRPRRVDMIAFQVSDMTCSRGAGAVTKALKAVDHAALVRVDLATFTVEIEPSRATARQLSDAIKRAGYSPVAA